MRMLAAALCAVAALAQAETRTALLSVMNREGEPVLDLEPDEIELADGGAAREVVSVTPASYPIAVILDTSGVATTDFSRLRDAAKRYVDSLSGRQVALYVSGKPASRIVDYTETLEPLDRALEHAFASPTASPGHWSAIIDASRDLKALRARLSRIVVICAGGSDVGSTTPRDVWKAVQASRSIVDVVDMRRESPGTPASPENIGRRPLGATRANGGDEHVFRTLADRSRGRYERIYTSSDYATALDSLRHQIESEIFVEYSVPAGAARDLRVAIRLPGAIVHGIGLDDR